MSSAIAWATAGAFLKPAPLNPAITYRPDGPAGPRMGWASGDMSYIPAWPWSGTAAASNPERNRAHNRRVVLEAIRLSGHMGRTEIARRRMLVVLDNASSEEQVRPLLPGSGPSTVLVTSRETLTGLVVREGAVYCQLSGDEINEQNIIKQALGVISDE